jgi:hypothetical protein
MFQRVALGREKVLGPGHPHTLEVVNCLKQLNMGIKRNGNQNSSVDQGLSKRKNGKGKWWQWKGLRSS